MNCGAASAGPDSEVRLSIDSRLENVFLVGLALRAYAGQLGFAAADANLVELAVVEAVNNAIKHTHDGRPDRRVEVRVSTWPQWLDVEVSCSGRCIPELARPNVDFPLGRGRANLAEGGMGLMIIDQIMDEVRCEIVGGRQVLTMKKRRPLAP